MSSGEEKLAVYSYEDRQGPIKTRKEANASSENHFGS